MQANRETTAPRSFTRRAAMSSVAAAAASGFATPAAAGTDPIFAAIEAHKAAFLHASQAYRAMAALEDAGPTKSAAYIAAEAASDAAAHVADNAAIALTNIRSTTLAGVVALLAHVDEFNRNSWQDAGVYSDHEWWPSDLIEDGTKTAAGKPLEMPFAFWLLRNVQAALQSIALA